MRKVFAFAAGLFLAGIFCLTQAESQMLHLGAGARKIVVAGFQGPGDVVANATFWGGFRGYNAADTADAADVCLPLDTICAHLTLSGGSVVVPGSLSTCNITTVICTIKTLFDKSGANACAGAVPCDMTQATEANRPTFRPAIASNNCPTTSLPCMQFNGSQSLGLPNLTAANIPQPYTGSYVAIRTGATSSFGIVIDGGGNGVFLGWSNAANTGLLDCGSVVGTTLSDNAYHAVQNVCNGASSDLNIDGTQNILSAGANAFPQAAATIGGTLNLTGNVAEAGVWSVAFSTTNSSNMSSNQHAYWGF